MLLRDALQRALARRTELLARLHAEGTDCYRLLHGTAEHAPGVTVDRYGPVLLVQSFRDAVPAADVDAVQRTVAAELGLELPVAANHRGAAPPEPVEPHVPAPAALADAVCRERRL